MTTEERPAALEQDISLPMLALEQERKLYDAYLRGMEDFTAGRYKTFSSVEELEQWVNAR